MPDDKKDLLDQLADDITEDPDAPDKANAATPPQTVANEPAHDDDQSRD